MEKGKIVKSVGIELHDGKAIKSLQEGDSYKYLGILEINFYKRRWSWMFWRNILKG